MEVRYDERGDLAVQVDLFISMPVYLHGLANALLLHGLVVVGAGTSARDGLSPGVDVVVADVGALPEGVPASFTDTSGEQVPLVLIAGDASCSSSNAHEVVDLRSSVEAVVEAVHRAALSNRPRGALAPTSPARLSEREQQVLRLIATGRTHGQISRMLGISPHTVDTHVKRMKAKLAVGTKAELTSAALLSAGASWGIVPAGFPRSA